MKRSLLTLSLVLWAGLFTLAPSPARSESRSGNDKKVDKAVAVKIPESLKAEHEELHAELDRAIKAGGKTGEAAQAVAKVLHGHFEKEEEYALPPLGLLPALAQGKSIAEMEKVIGLTDKLKAELPQMLQEHRLIVAALNRLVEAAKDESKTEYVHFAEKLKLHAQTEEEVMYPAAILVGEHLKLKLRK